MFRRPSSLTGFWMVTSAICILPPGTSTRKSSAKTASLSGIRSMTPLEIDDVEAPVRERQPLGLALDELDVRGAHLGRCGAGLGQHLRCHVDSGHTALLADHLRGDERVGARAGAEVEHTFAGLEPAELPGIGDAGKGLDRGVGHVRELGG